MGKKRHRERREGAADGDKDDEFDSRKKKKESRDSPGLTLAGSSRVHNDGVVLSGKGLKSFNKGGKGSAGAIGAAQRKIWAPSVSTSGRDVGVLRDVHARSFVSPEVELGRSSMFVCCEHVSLGMQAHFGRCVYVEYRLHHRRYVHLKLYALS